MTDYLAEHIEHPSAWKSSDFASQDDFSFDLEECHRDAFDRALSAAVRKGKGLSDIEHADFAMPEIADELASLKREITRGRGLVLIRGFPIDRYLLEEMSMIYAGVGSHFGRAVSQSALGDRLGYVTHNPEEDVAWRGYRSTKELKLHTDSDEIISLLSIRQAKSGGLSQLASALAVHNEMVERRPDLLPPLYEGYYYHWFGERPPGEGPISTYKIPVFSKAEGLVSICYLRGTMAAAAAERGESLSDELNEALDLFEEIANREDISLRFMMRPGYAFFINNLTVLHSRTGFEDWPEKERRRLLLRLWFVADPPRPLHPNLKRYYDDLKLAYRDNEA